ncbi:MAG TPA: hypothetical protein VGQ57_21365, partial [Polyangiaceae bacterium]|nr:hypothetical protein [Polyangiaceae bacterium]
MLSRGRRHAPALPWPARAANRTGALLRTLGLELGELDPVKLRVEAVALAGCDDFGDASYEPGLAAVIASAERDARLSLIGRLGIHDAIVNALANRLLRVRARRVTPGAFAPTLVPPVIVMGLPRSGTPLLHRLLALAPSARPL